MIMLLTSLIFFDTSHSSQQIKQVDKEENSRWHHRVAYLLQG